MLHAFRLGPIEFPEGDQLVYAALGDAGPVQPVFARSDEEGLRDLVAAGGGEPVQCEPGLATAARSIGLRWGRLPPEALRDYRRRRGSVDELLRYAEVCRVARVMRPYLEALS